MKLRRERWGAWAKLDDPPALVRLTILQLQTLGHQPRADAPLRERPLEVHMAVTQRCPVSCSGCYTGATNNGLVPSFSDLSARLDSLSSAGVFMVAFGGGEPLTRTDLDQCARAAKERGISPVLTTSGIGLSDEHLEALRQFDQINVSYDGPGDTYRDVRGFDASAVAERAIARLSNAGIRVGINLVLTRASFRVALATSLRAIDLGASEVQLLRYKPAGRARSLDYYAKRLSTEQTTAVGRLVRELCIAVRPKDASVRIDCALVPFLVHGSHVSTDELATWGIFGCEAARHLESLDIHGLRAGCSFLPSSNAGADTYGSAVREVDEWSSVPTEDPCLSCHARDVCRGGCKAVSLFVTNVVGPDPECPRVRALA